HSTSSLTFYRPSIRSRIINALQVDANRLRSPSIGRIGRRLNREQESINALELVVREDLLPGRHALGRAPFMHGRPEFLAHLVAVTVTQEPQINLTLALDRVGTVTMRAGAVEGLLARAGSLGVRRERIALGLRRHHVGDLHHGGPGSGSCRG